MAFTLADIPPEADEFLAETRLGVLVRPAEPWPVAVPVWFEWTGSEIAFFSRETRPKNDALRSNPRVSFLVSAELHEPVYWVAVDGTATVHDTGGAELMERLFPRYFDTSAPEIAATFDEWKAIRTTFVRITITPDRIRHFVA